MPYRHAHWFVLALVCLAGYAFWPSYVSNLPAATPGMHVHGLTALVWMLLLATQSWTIHAGHRRAHRILGCTSLAIFPLVLAGMGFLEVTMARTYVEGTSDWHVAYAARFGAADIVAVIGMAYFYFMALRERAKVRLHAGYMLATIVFLVGTILNRSLPDIVGLVAGPDVDVSSALAVPVAIVTLLCLLAALHHFAAVPTRVVRDVAIFVVAQLLFWETIGRWPVWEQLYAALAQADPLVIGGSHLAVGILAAAAGWRLGKRPPRSAAAPTAP
jgi:hypothetical protein